MFKKKSYAYYTDQVPRKPFVPFAPSAKPSKKEQLVSDYTSTPSAKAEQGLVQAGNREKAVVVALKIKNKINAEAEKFLESMMEHAYQKKGACYKQGEFIYTIFASVMTKAVNNEMRAVHTAEKFSTELKEYNRKFKERIEWGIGINTGEIIASAMANKLQFTALGSFMIAAKKLAQFADKKIMFTKDAYQKVSNEIKADKLVVEGGEYYEIKQIVDLEKNKKFIDDFLKREGKIK